LQRAGVRACSPPRIDSTSVTNVKPEKKSSNRGEVAPEVLGLRMIDLSSFLRCGERAQRSLREVSSRGSTRVAMSRCDSSENS
jgi:hypothetical protein